MDGKYVWAAFGAALLASAANAQSINIDFGDALGTPPDSYAGAAGQPGHWNSINFVGDELKFLDLSGLPTELKLKVNLPFGPAFTNSDPTTGGDEALLDDYLDLHSVPTSFEFLGFAPGRYEVFVYAWAPDSKFYKTFVMMKDHLDIVGGRWHGGLFEHLNYARAIITVEEHEKLRIDLFGLVKGTLNGIQIVQLSDEESTD